MSEQSSGGTLKVASATNSQRLIALDVLRGITIFLMLLVNNFGRTSFTPVQLLHAGWMGGVHLADFVFPWFMFCVGVAIPYSAASFKSKKLPTWKYDLRVIRRVLLLILLGIITNSCESCEITYTIGVLQLIAGAYAVGALLYELPAHRRLYFALLMLISYWAALKLLQIPGVGSGFLKPGVNFINHINQKYLASLGLEGLPLVIPASALVLISTAIGDLMKRTDLTEKKKALILCISGAVMILSAYIWSFSIAFNKPLWTPSFILLTTGCAAVILSILHMLINVKNITNWTFVFIVFGSNAILAYVLPILVKSLMLRPFGLNTAGWLRVSLYTIFWWFVFYILYRKKLFFKV